MMIRLRGDRVLVRHDPLDDMTESGLLLPESAPALDLGVWSEVVGLGPGRRLKDGTIVPTDLKVGDRAYLSRNKGLKTATLNDEYRIVNEDDVLGVEL